MRQAFEILMRRKRAFLIPFLVVFLVPTLITALFLRTYDADSIVWLDSDVTLGSVMDGAPQTADQRPIQQSGDTLQQLVKTRTFMSALIHRTTLRNDMGTPRQREKTIAYVQRNLKTEVAGDNSLRITFSAASPKEAVSVVAAVTDSFLTWVRTEVKSQSDKSVQFFERQSQQYRQELATATDRLRDFRQAYPDARQLDIRDKVLTPPPVTLTPAQQAQYEQLKAEQEYAQSVYDKSLDDLAKNRVQAAAREERYLNGLRIVDKPVAPTGFAKTRLALAAFLAFMAAAVVGTVGAGLAELNDRTFHEKHDVEETLELPVLVETRREHRDVKKA